MAYFDQYTQPRRRPVGGSPAFASAPTSTGRSPYDATPFASMHNSGANDYFKRTGVMPNTTYGGNFGQALPNPDNVPSAYQQMQNAVGDPYAPMHQQPLGMAPTNMTQYGARMSQQNPNGTFFGGALPAYGTSSGGQTRPMFLGAPHDFGHQKPFPLDYQGKYQQNAAGQIVHGGGWSDSDQNAMNAASAQFDARRGGLAQRQQDYQQRNFFDMAQRKAGVLSNARNRADARRARMGIGDPVDMAMRGNPGIAGMMGMQQLQNQDSQGWMNQQGQQFTQELQMKQQQQNFDRWKELNTAALKATNEGNTELASHYSGIADQLGRHLFGQPGGNGTFPGAAPGSLGGGANGAAPGGLSGVIGSPPANTSQAMSRIDAKVRAAVPPERLATIVTEPDKAKRDAMMTAAGVTDHTVRARIHQQAKTGKPGHDQFGAPLRKPSWWSEWLSGLTHSGFETPSGQRVNIVNGQMVPIGGPPSAAAPSAPSNHWGIPTWQWGF